jgi:hypothetical protein
VTIGGSATLPDLNFEGACGKPAIAMEVWDIYPQDWPDSLKESLGEIMQDQQRLMDETFKLDQALKDRMQRGDPGDGEDGEFLEQMPPEGEDGQQPQQGQDGQEGQQGSPTDRMTAEQLREALKNLRPAGCASARSRLQKGLLGWRRPSEGQSGGGEMRGAGEALGAWATGGGGQARKRCARARDMMNQMMQAGRGRAKAR